MGVPVFPVARVRSSAVVALAAVIGIPLLSAGGSQAAVVTAMADAQLVEPPSRMAPRATSDVAGLPSGTRSYEWRQIRSSSLPAMTADLTTLHDSGVSRVSLDLTSWIDVTETPAAELAAATERYLTRLDSYMAEAARNDIVVDAVVGEPRLVNPGSQYAVKVFTDFVHMYNGRVDTPSPFVAIGIDIEPWGHPDWPANRVKLTRRFLTVISDAVSREQALPQTLRIPISVALPFWWDAKTASKRGALNGTFLVPTRRAVKILSVGSGNDVVIMAYRDTVDGADGTAALAAKEFAFASRLGDRVDVVVGQEAQRLSPDKITYFQEGFDVLAASAMRIQEVYGGHPAYGGIAVDGAAQLARWGS